MFDFHIREDTFDFLSVKDLISCILVNIYALIYGGNAFNYVKENTTFKNFTFFLQRAPKQQPVHIPGYSGFLHLFLSQIQALFKQFQGEFSSFSSTLQLWKITFSYTAHTAYTVRQLFYFFITLNQMFLF